MFITTVLTFAWRVASLSPNYSLLAKEVDGSKLEADALVALLLPSVAGIIYSLPTTHQITGNLTFFSRMIIGTMSIASFTVAMGVAFHASGAAARWLWQLSVLGCFVGTTILLTQFARSIILKRKLEKRLRELTDPKNHA